MSVPKQYLYLVVFLAGLLGAGCLHPVQAGETELPPTESLSKNSEAIWSGLVVATTEEHPKEIPPELKKYSEQLKNIFGYNQYELIGEHTELIDSLKEHWLIPSKEFSLKVDAQKAKKPGFHYRLKLDLYQDEKLIAKLDARLCGQNLLFIRGPYYGKGQLVIVLVVK